MERTFVAIKPDGVERNLIGEIISRFEKKGFKIVGLKMLHMSRALAEEHYAEHEGKSFYENLVNFISSGPIVAMVIEGINAVSEVRKLVGSTDPQQAQPGTIRADYAMVKESNIIHASDCRDSAQREITLFFDKSEICEGWHVPSEKWLPSREIYAG